MAMFEAIECRTEAQAEGLERPPGTKAVLAARLRATHGVIEQKSAGGTVGILPVLGRSYLDSRLSRVAYAIPVRYRSRDDSG